MTFAALRDRVRRFRMPLKKHSLLTNSDRQKSNLFNGFFDEAWLRIIEHHHDIATWH